MRCGHGAGAQAADIRVCCKAAWIATILDCYPPCVAESIPRTLAGSDKLWAGKLKAGSWKLDVGLACSEPHPVVQPSVA